MSDITIPGAADPALPDDDLGDEIRLADLEFTDIYVSMTGQVMIRGADDADGPLTEVPPGAINDLDALQLTVFERGQGKEGSFFVDYDGIRYRCQKIDALGGVWFTLRKSKARIPRLSELGGFPKPVMTHLAWLGRQKGLILISGATGNGKTTTACSLLREYLMAFGDIAVTIEDPPELPLDGPHGHSGHCFQLRLEDDDFGAALKHTLRMTPRYILLGELRTPRDASQAIRAAISGHLVITTIHAGSVEDSITSLLKLASGSDPVEMAQNLIADGLAGVINQELVKVNNRRRLKVRYLFPGEDKGIRAKIRDGSVSTLGTEIEQQATRVMQGRPPVDIARK